VDFDHQFLEAEKYDSKRTYKGFDGYSPGVFTIGGLIAYLENRVTACLSPCYFVLIKVCPLTDC
jgi:hypothetical protein